jgi:regulator of protease activity HflC (stomatin/prohibitin superfamily)
VRTGEWGVFVRFEKVVYKRGMPKLAAPGLRPLIPWLWMVRTISVMDRSSDLSELTVDRKSGQINVRPSVTWHVMTTEDHPYRALFLVDNLPATVANICGNALRTVFESEGVTDDQLGNADELFEMVDAQCREELRHYGVRLLAVNLISRALTPAEKLSGNAKMAAPAYLLGPDAGPFAP